MAPGQQEVQVRLTPQTFMTGKLHTKAACICAILATIASVLRVVHRQPMLRTEHPAQELQNAQNRRSVHACNALLA